MTPFLHSVPVSILLFFVTVTISAQSPKVEIIDAFNRALDDNSFVKYWDKQKLEYSPVTVQGKIRGYSEGKSENSISIYVDDVVRQDQVSSYSKVATDGSFSIELELAIAQDILISYQRNFSIFASPGDSIYVEFDGRTRSRPEIYRTLDFAQDGATLNRALADYYRTYYRKRNLAKMRSAADSMQPLQYIDFLENIKWERIKDRQEFLDKYDHDQKFAALTYLNIEYAHIHHLLRFGGKKFYDNQFKIDNREYYMNVLEQIPIITQGAMLDSQLGLIVNKLSVGILPIFDEYTPGKDAWEHSIQSVLNHTPDTGKLRELSLAEKFQSMLSRYDTIDYYANVIDKEIRTPVILKNLQDLQGKVKLHSENPELASQIQWLKIHAEDHEGILQKLKEDYPGKILFIDFWATWCGSCITEMYHSNQLHDHFENDDVVFVYFCLDGINRQKTWERIITDKGLKGSQLALSKKQAAQLQSGLGFTSVPHYLLIDSEGQIVEQGSHLRPSNGTARRLIEVQL